MSIQWNMMADAGRGLAQGIDTAFNAFADARQKEAAQALIAKMMQPQAQQPMTLAALNQPSVDAPQPVQQAAYTTQPPGNFPKSLIGTESGGNWGAQNNVRGAGGLNGHFGRLQFGQARLQDAKNAGVIPQGMTPQQFMASPEAQQRVEQWHFADIDQSIQRNGLDKAIGSSINGVPVTMDGMRAVAHLGGTGGLQKFIQTGGAYNPADANGTSLLSYLSQHKGQTQTNPLANVQPMQPSAPAQQPVTLAQLGQMPQQPAINMETLAALSTNKYGAPIAQAIIAKQLARDPVEQQMAQVKLAQAMQQLQGGNPMQQQLSQAQLEAAQLANQRARAEMAGEGAKLSQVDLGENIGFVNQKGELVRQIPKSQKPVALGEDQRLVNPSTGQTVAGPSSTGQKLTEAQSKDLSYYTRGVGAENTLQKIEGTLANTIESARANPWLPIVGTMDGLGNRMASGKYQAAQQAGREVLASILRKDTGAAVTAQEMDLYGKMFLPQPGDTQQVIQQKRESRQRALTAIKQGLGKAEALAAARIEPNGGAQQQGQQQSPPQRLGPNDKSAFDAMPSGTRFIDPNGVERIKP